MIESSRPALKTGYPTLAEIDDRLKEEEGFLATAEDDYQAAKTEEARREAWKAMKRAKVNIECLQWTIGSLSGAR